MRWPRDWSSDVCSSDLQLRSADRGRVDAALGGSGPQQRVDVVDRPDPAADGQGDEDLLRGRADHVEHGATAGGGRGHVQEGELIGALGPVAGGQLDGIAGVAQALEVHALDDAAGVDVQAGDDSDGDTHASILSRSSSSAPSMMNCLRGATSEPISSSNMALAA